MIFKEDQVWGELYKLKTPEIQDLACTEYLQGLSLIAFDPNKVPSFNEVNLKLRRKGWKILPVEGMIAPETFFSFLKFKYFPVVNSLRKKADHLDSEDPDLWHDLFGHIPFLFNPLFSEIYQLFGELGTQAMIKGSAALNAVSRIYWHTMEFGVIQTASGLRAYGAGIIPSPKELKLSLTDEVRKKPFHLPSMTEHPYQPGILHKELYVVDSFSQLIQELKEWSLAAGIL